MSVPVSFVSCEDTRTSEQVGSLSHILLLLCFYSLTYKKTLVSVCGINEQKYNISFLGSNIIVIKRPTQAQTRIEHPFLFLSKYISKGAMDMKFLPDVGSNPSNLHTKRNKAIDVHETNYVPVI